MYYYDPPSERKWLRPTNLKKVLLCIVIIILVLLVKKVNMPFSQAILAKINFYISEDNYELKDIQGVLKQILQIQEAIPVFNQPKNAISMMMPVSGNITSTYGIRMHPILKVERMHNGIDIDGEEGTPVKVVLDGKVLSVQKDEELGNVVKVDHGNGLITVYAHLKDVYVKKDEQLKKGFILGTVGESGLAEGPHLHFEVWQNDKPINPELWLKGLKKS